MPEIVFDASMGMSAEQAPRPTRKKKPRVGRPGSHHKEILTTSQVDSNIHRKARGGGAAGAGAFVPSIPEVAQPPTTRFPAMGTSVQVVRQKGFPLQPTEVALWVVIPTHNRPKEFPRCLERVLAELGPDDRVVVVASGFRMFQAVREASRHPSVIGLLFGDCTVNEARRHANGIVPEGAAIVETGDNDFITTGSLDRIREAFEDPKLGVVYGNLQFLDIHGRAHGPMIRKPAWEKGIMHRRCEVKGLHAYRKIVYEQYGGWYQSEWPAGDHANAIRWEDAGVKFKSIGGPPLVCCTWDPEGMSTGKLRSQQHHNSQQFARGHYRRKYSVGMACWAVAGRRTKMLALIDDICDQSKVRIYACARGRYGAACDTDEHIRKRIVWWKAMSELDEHLPKHEVSHLFVDRLNFATRSAALGRRVVVDICDLRSQRTGTHDDPDEKILCTSPNVWLMFVSEGHRDYICEKYGMPIERTHIVPNLPMKSWRPEEPITEEEKVPNSLVYYGGITAKRGHTAAYRCYYDLFLALKNAGVDVHIYPSGARKREVEEGYAEFTVHERFDHRDIYKILRKYTVGFAGYEDRAGCPKVSHDYAMKCYPNKATDYMMAGIPTVSYALGLAEKDVQNWGVCVPKGSAGRLADAYEEARIKVIDYERWQNIFCMESQADKLIEAYDWVAGRKG